MGSTSAPCAVSAGEQLDDIMQRMDAAYAAWRAADHPLNGPTADAREAVYADLRAWTARLEGRAAGRYGSWG
jgi:hypothetical protein